MAPLEPGPGKPETMEVALGQRHGGVEADDREETRDVEDGLDDLFADSGVEVVELRGVVPGETGTVVAVVDIASFAAGFVAAAENDGCIGLVEIVVFNLDFDSAVVGEIGAVVTVGGIGSVWAGDEPLGVLDDPGRVDAHVVRHHITGQANAVMEGAVAKIDVGRLASEVVGDGVVEERIGRGDCVAVSAELLDGFARHGCAPRRRSATANSCHGVRGWRDLRRGSRRGGRYGDRIGG